jgi:hypothetical protein
VVIDTVIRDFQNDLLKIIHSLFVGKKFVADSSPTLTGLDSFCPYRRMLRMKFAPTRTVKFENGTIISVWKDGDSWVGEVDFKTSVIGLGPRPSEESAMYQAHWVSGSKQDFSTLCWKDGKRIIRD